MATKYYTSLFKQSDVRITTKFSSSHKGIDLSRGVARQPLYLPNKAVEATVWKILPEYTLNGVLYKNSPIIYLKHKDGQGSRYIHSYPKDVKVKVGDKVVAGQQICCTGNSGASNGDHCHYEWLTKYNDLNTRVDPTPYVINDKATVLEVGTRLQFSGDMNLRDSYGKIIGTIKKGAVGEIFKVREFDGTYQWYKIKFLDIKGVVADTNLNKVTTKVITNLDGTIPTVEPTPTPTPIEPPVDPQPTEQENEINRLKGLIERLEATTATQGAELEQSKLECAELQKKYDTLYVERNRLENEKNEAIAKLKESSNLLLVSTGELIAEIWRRILSLK